MRIFSKSTIKEYGEANPRVKEELNTWYAIVSLAKWSNFNELKADMPATDYLGNDRYVFNVKGNHYRVIAMIFFPTQRLYIRAIYTHAEYTKNRSKLPNL